VGDYTTVFGVLPERTRPLRALQCHQDWCQRFLAQSTLFTVINTYGIELNHPLRQGRCPTALGKKGFSNRRWIVEAKLCWLMNATGRVVAWTWNTANTHDQHFRSLAHDFDGTTIVLSDHGFKKAGEEARNLKFCARKTWSVRMMVETAFSLVTRVRRLKQITHRSTAYLTSHLA
jgi:hypothetical protein